MNFKRCSICGHSFKNLEFAKHMAMHSYQERVRIEQMKKGRCTSLKPSIE